MAVLEPVVTVNWHRENPGADSESVRLDTPGPSVSVEVVWTAPVRVNRDATTVWVSPVTLATSHLTIPAATNTVGVNRLLD